VFILISKILILNKINTNYLKLSFMNNLLKIFVAFFIIGFAYGQDLSEPKGGGVLDIVVVSPGEGYSDMNFEGQISGYGTVFVKFKVASINTSKTSGTLDGQGRTILEDGTLISTPLKGTWKRNGELMKFYFTDAINNGAMNFVMWDVDVLKKTATVKYFELHSPNN